MLVTHAFQFSNEATAKAALPQFTVDDGEGGTAWNRGYCDPGIPITTPSGTFDADGNEIMTPVSGWFMNVALPALDVTLPGLTAAWAETGTLLFGTKPKTPQRVFA
jgi:hypothetical protein